MTMNMMNMPSPLRRRVAVPAAILLAAAAGCLLRAPQAPIAARDEPPARALRLADADGPPRFAYDELDEAAALAAHPSDDVSRHAARRLRKELAGLAAHPSDDVGLHAGRTLRALRLMPAGEFVRYDSGPRREALRAALPCAGDKDVHVWWMRDIDYEQPGLCGGAKCFFRSLCDPSRGYLVQAGAKPHSYDVALDLEGKYGIKHFYASPPFQTRARRFVDRLTDEYLEFYEGAAEEEEMMVVQPVIAAPEGTTVLRCNGPRRKWLTDRLEQVLWGTDAAAKDRLIKDLEHTAELTKAEPKLINDFQVMVDPEGNVYQLDFDRMQRGPPTKRVVEFFSHCMDHAIEFVNALKDNDQDAKAKLYEKIQQWETEVYDEMKVAEWYHHLGLDLISM